MTGAELQPEVGDVVKATPGTGFGGTGLKVRRTAIVSVMVVTAVFTMTSAVSARSQLVSADRAQLGAAAKAKKPLTKKQYIAKANALCDAAASAFVPVTKQFAPQLQGNSQPSPQVIAAFVKALASVVQHQINTTRALVPPKHDQAKLKKMLSLNQDALTKVKADPTLLAGKHNPFLAADTIARNYGLEGAAGSGPCTGKSQRGGSGSGGAQSGTAGSPPAS
jgi:hypothetical protein